MKLIVSVLIVFVTLAGAQDAAPTGGRQSPGHIVTRTRTVAIFSDLEERLMAAVQKKDQATLSALFADDFELRNASDPATPVPRDAWLAALTASDLRDFRISQMAVHLYDETTAAVSMHYWQNALVEGKERASNAFVVDIWRKSGNDWKLAVRYCSSTAPPSSANPGAKPSGKQ